MSGNFKKVKPIPNAFIANFVVKNAPANVKQKIFRKDGKITKKVERWFETQFLEGKIQNIPSQYRDRKKVFDARTNKFIFLKANETSKKGFLKLPNINFSKYSKGETNALGGSLLKNFLNQQSFQGNSRLVIRSRGATLYDKNININSSIKKWWNENYKSFMIGDTKEQRFLWTDFKGEADQTEFFLTPYENLNHKYYDQAYLKGINHCFIHPILNYYNEKIKYGKITLSTKKKHQSRIFKLEGKQKKQTFKNGYLQNFNNRGVQEHEIIEICKDLNIGVEIVSPLSKKVFFSFKTINPDKIFKFINTRENHLELNWTGTKFDKCFFNDDENKIFVDTVEELYKLVKNTDTPIYTKNKYGINKVFIKDKTYAIKEQQNETLKEFKNDFNYYKKQFKTHKDPNAQEFINDSVKFQSTYDLIDTSEYRIVDDIGIRLKKEIPNNIRHIDMEKAFANFHLNKFYKGFIGKVQEWRKTKNNNYDEVGIYFIENIDFCECNPKFKLLNDELSLYEYNGVYPKADLDLLNFYGVKFDVLYKMTGTKLDFKFTNEMMTEKFIYQIGNKKKEVPLYSKFVGECNILSKQDTIYTTGTKKHFEYLVEDGVDIQYPLNKSGINEASISYDKKDIRNNKHITSFILAYQRGNIIEQLMELEIDKIIRVVVDGIYFYEHHKPIKLKNCFRYKDEDRNFNNYPDFTFISKTEKRKWNKNDIGEYRNTKERKILYKGQGGNGKTHKNLIDKGFLDVLFVAPSWLLCSDKKNDYIKNKNIDIVPHFHILNEPYKSKIKDNYSNIIIDEGSMITEFSKDEIFNFFSNENLIFCGDLNYQLPPVINIKQFFKNEINEFGSIQSIPKIIYDDKYSKIHPNKLKEMTEKDFDKIILLKDNYRFKDDYIKDLVKICRAKIESKSTFNLKDVIKNLKNYTKIISLEEVKQIYNTNDLILCSTNRICDEYTETFKDLEKYIITENYPNLNLFNSQIIFDKNENVKYKLRHGFTIHIIQGRTTEKNIYIDLRELKGWRMFYTAISRAKYINQLHFILP